MSRILFTITIFCASFTLNAQNDQAKLANEYFQQGEYAKAQSLYEDLDKNKSAIPLIHSNYLQLMLDQQEYSKAEKYLERVLKTYPGNLQYKIDLAFVYHITGDTDKLTKYLNELKKEYIDNQYQLSNFAQNLVARQLYDQAISFY
ncbi:MAG: hypothetical protein RJQ14_02150, partial [Marinoscillum sp.]